MAIAENNITSKIFGLLKFLKNIIKHKTKIGWIVLFLVPEISTPKYRNIDKIIYKKICVLYIKIKINDENIA
jgi:hypothetical protein